MKYNKFLKHLSFWFPLLTLTSISLLIMYHTKYISNIYENNFIKQIIWFSIGYGILSLSKLLPIKSIFKYSKYLYLLGIISLILVLLIGNSINGSKAWLSIGPISFQPSEIMKLFYTCYLTHLVCNTKTFNAFEELSLLIKVFLLFLIPTVLIFLEPDTGGVIYLLIITITILLNSTIRKRWFIIIAIIIAILSYSFIYFYIYNKELLINLIGTSFFYRVERILDFKKGLQIENALTAIGNAPFISFNLTKVGVYIPESATDFIFALSSNVFGLLGPSTILLSYLILDYYLISYCQKISKKEYRLFGYSFTSLLIISELINIAMNLSLVPIIGIPLPFLSYGGSGTITLFMYLSLLFANTNDKDNSKNKNSSHKGKVHKKAHIPAGQHYK